MKLRVFPSLVVLGLCSALTGTASAAGNADAGRSKAFTCLGCHGIPSYNNAYPTYKVPKLGGQHEQYIISALQAYKAGQRGHDTMHAQAYDLTEEDMADIAAFFATHSE